MKTFIYIGYLIIIGFNICCADTSKNGYYGTGEHYIDNVDQWSGKEEVITRLAKKEATYEFMRINEDEFLIRDQTSKEVFFKFHRIYGRGRAFVRSTKLVDVYRDNDQITALLFCDHGYFLISTAKKQLPLEKGRFPLISKVEKAEGWNVRFYVPTLDYYEDRDIGASLKSKIAAVKLTGLEAIQFTYKSPKGDATETDTFTFANCKLVSKGARLQPEADLLKNGKFLRSVARESERDETQMAHDLEKTSNEDIRKLFPLIIGNKEEFLSMLLANNRDRKNYDTIKKRLDEAFAEK